MKRLLFALAVAGFMYSCETEIDIDGNSEPTAVVYAILDKSESKHIVKVTKTFLGEGNAFDFAKIADSSYIPNLKPIIERYLNGKLDLVYPVFDTILKGKPEGTFFSGDVKAFYFNDAGLTTEAGYDYRIRFEFNGKTVEAKTIITGTPLMRSPDPNRLTIESIQSDVSSQELKYQPISVSISPSVNSVRYEINLGFTYREVYNDDSFEDKSVILGRVVQNNTQTAANSAISHSFEGQQLMDALRNLVKDAGSNVKYREIKDFTFHTATAAPEFTTFIEINNPVTAVLQERPEFTNVNNGLGIFSSKEEILHNIPVGTKTSKFMIIYQGWLEKKFCSRLSALAADPNLRCP